MNKFTSTLAAILVSAGILLSPVQPAMAGGIGVNLASLTNGMSGAVHMAARVSYTTSKTTGKVLGFLVEMVNPILTGTGQFGTSMLVRSTSKVIIENGVKYTYRTTVHGVAANSSNTRFRLISTTQVTTTLVLATGLTTTSSLLTQFPAETYEEFLVGDVYNHVTDSTTFSDVNVHHFSTFEVRLSVGPNQVGTVVHIPVGGYDAAGKAFSGWKTINMTQGSHVFSITAEEISQCIPLSQWVGGSAPVIRWAEIGWAWIENFGAILPPTYVVDLPY